MSRSSFHAPPFHPPVGETENQIDDLCSVVEQMFAVGIALMGTAQRNQKNLRLQGDGFLPLEIGQIGCAPCTGRVGQAGKYSRPGSKEC